MVKRTLYFGNPAMLSTTLEQLVISRNEQADITVPIEDVGLVIIDHHGVAITQMLMAKLLENNTALIICNEKHLPTGLMLNLNGHQLRSARFKAQIEASLPLKKQLWQQTISAKLYNQSALLNKYPHSFGEGKGGAGDYLIELSKDVKSGDSGNLEAQGAAYYWKHIFAPYLPAGFARERAGSPPNNMLNYGYAILRATVARSLVGSGLLPTLGIFHRNQYNAYCLADDIMEPYRPYVDEQVLLYLQNNPLSTGEGLGVGLTPAIKQYLLNTPALNVTTDGEEGPLMVHLNRTTTSLNRCYEGASRKLVFPTLT